MSQQPLNTSKYPLVLVEDELEDISSTIIRNRLKSHQSIDELCPPCVSSYMHSHNLVP